MIEETEKSRKAKKAQIGLDRPKPMTDLDDLDAYITHVAELRAEIDRLRAALQACVLASKDWMEKAKAALEPEP